MQILLIDDEPMYFKMMAKGLEKAGYQLEYARTGQEGLAMIAAKNPDIIVVDLKLPDINGFEIIKRLRDNPDFSHIPIIVITGKRELEDKLEAFALGADDYLVKPFEVDELVARIGILARRGNAMKVVRKMEADKDRKSTVVAVHSLRGGVGCSSLSLNLALAFNNLWSKRTLLLDAVITAGQISMMLNTAPRVTLENYADSQIGAIDEAVVDDLSNVHKSGLRFAVACKLPVAIDAYSSEFWNRLLELFIHQNEFIVVDTPHDFSDGAIHMLNSASQILLVMGPELSSLKAAGSALNIYDRLGIQDTKFKVVLNMTTNHSGIRQSQLEKALGIPISYVLPYSPDEVVRAINFGEPFILENPEMPISARIEDMAYALSDESYKNLPPAIPSPTWKRVTERLPKK